jgi:hypothetical protein
MDKVEELLKETETVNERYIEDFNHYTDEIERWLPSVSSTIISSAQNVVKILHFLELEMTVMYDDILFSTYTEGEYIGVYLNKKGILICFAPKENENELSFAQFSHEELIDVG